MSERTAFIEIYVLLFLSSPCVTFRNRFLDSQHDSLATTSTSAAAAASASTPSLIEASSKDASSGGSATSGESNHGGSFFLLLLILAGVAAGVGVWKLGWAGQIKLQLSRVAGQLKDRVGGGASGSYSQIGGLPK